MGDLTGGSGTPAWLSLLGPLPDDASPTRRPVLGQELQTAHAGSEVAGWTSLTLHLSAPPIGLRVLLGTFDQSGRLKSGSDLVHRRAGGRLEQHSVAGRFEEDGSFRGTRWVGNAPDTDEETTDWALEPSSPSSEEVARLRELIAELERREQR